MKLIMNMTTSSYDTQRYRDNADLKDFYKGLRLDGLELLQYGEDEKGIIQPEDVIGVHLRYFTSWVDLWKGDQNRLLQEFDNWDTVTKIYGGTTRESLIDFYKNNLQSAAKFSPEYLVFHVSECGIAEFVKKEFHYSDEDVVDSVIELVNEISESIKGEPLLLFENLWYCGLTMVNPALIRRLLNGINYKNKGIMLDIGHLLHTNTSLRTLDEGVDYILGVLNEYEDLSLIKGIHMHQTLSGEYSQGLKTSWNSGQLSHELRYGSVLEHIFKIDSHQPFTNKNIYKIIEKISPEYLVLEQISTTREEHENNLRLQLEYLQ